MRGGSPADRDPLESDLDRDRVAGRPDEPDGLGAGVGVAGREGADRLVETGLVVADDLVGETRREELSTGRPNCSTAPRLA